MGRTGKQQLKKSWNTQKLVISAFQSKCHLFHFGVCFKMNDHPLKIKINKLAHLSYPEHPFVPCTRTRSLSHTHFPPQWLFISVEAPAANPTIVTSRTRYNSSINYVSFFYLFFLLCCFILYVITYTHYSVTRTEMAKF